MVHTGVDHVPPREERCARRRAHRLHVVVLQQRAAARQRVDRRRRDLCGPRRDGWNRCCARGAAAGCGCEPDPGRGRGEERRREGGFNRPGSCRGARRRSTQGLQADAGLTCWSQRSRGVQAVNLLACSARQQEQSWQPTDSLERTVRKHPDDVLPSRASRPRCIVAQCAAALQLAAHDGKQLQRHAEEGEGEEPAEVVPTAPARARRPHAAHGPRWRRSAALVPRCGACGIFLTASEGL